MHILYQFSCILHLVFDLVFWYLVTNPVSRKRLPQKPGAGARGALRQVGKEARGRQARRRGVGGLAGKEGEGAGNGWLEQI